MKDHEKRARMLEAAAHCLHAAAHMEMLGGYDPSDIDDLKERAQDCIHKTDYIPDEENPNG